MTDNITNKGRAGSIRIAALSEAQLRAMVRHELREDYLGQTRVVRDGPDTDPLLYDAHGYGRGEIEESLATHIKGAQKHAKAAVPGAKVALHAFVQFPTDLPVTDANERMMLNQAIAFINENHGGRAVFHARLDRDEAGRHGVDVFFAPLYEKTTGRGRQKTTTTRVSLTHFGKKMATEAFGTAEKLKKSAQTGEFEVVLDKKGHPIVVNRDSSYLVGRVLQDRWHQHLQTAVGLGWAERGRRKIGRTPDRLEPEEYKLKQDIEKLNKQQLDLAQRTAAVEKLEAKVALDLKVAERQADEARAMLSRAARQSSAQDAREKVLNYREAKIAPLEQALTQRGRVLAEREKAVDDLEVGLSKRAAFLSVRENAADQHEKEINQRGAGLDQREADLRTKASYADRLRKALDIAYQALIDGEITGADVSPDGKARITPDPDITADRLQFFRETFHGFGRQVAELIIKIKTLLDQAVNEAVKRELQRMGIGFVRASSLSPEQREKYDLNDHTTPAPRAKPSRGRFGWTRGKDQEID